MTHPRLEKWNARYAERRGAPDEPPEGLLFEAMAHVTPGLALDVACGAGRHTLALAQAGFRVDAVDGSSEGLAMLARSAAAYGLTERIRCIEADLESAPPGFAFEPGRYDLVAEFFFLHREIFPSLREAVRPGGVFVAAIHCAAPDAPTSMNRAFTLLPGELEREVAAWGFEVLVARERTPRDANGSRASAMRHTDTVTAEIVARRPL
jgi:SAM-dependent methyltransferase